jgi:hypothetical protein
MNIHNIEGLSGEELRNLVNQGGKFVQYKTCISIVVMTFNNPTDIYFIGPGEKIYSRNYLISFNTSIGLVGHTLGTYLYDRQPCYFCTRGKDLTAAVMSEINQNDPTYGTGGYG